MECMGLSSVPPIEDNKKSYFLHETSFSINTVLQKNYDLNQTGNFSKAYYYPHEKQVFIVFTLTFTQIWNLEKTI